MDFPEDTLLLSNYIYVEVVDLLVWLFWDLTLFIKEDPLNNLI